MKLLTWELHSQRFWANSLPLLVSIYDSLRYISLTSVTIHTLQVVIASLLDSAT